MAEIGRKGGQATTPAKAAAARNNGRLGGLVSSEAKTAAARENAKQRWVNQPPSATARAREERARRNAPCQCSFGRELGKKFKQCCGWNPRERRSPTSIAAAVLPTAAMTNGQAVVGKVGRNDPCPCGSQRKFKKCCGNTAKLPCTASG